MLKITKRRHLQLFLSLFLTVFIFIKHLYADDSFPHRSSYPDVKTIELDELYHKKKQCLVIDVRSKVEYDVIHISDSINISLSKINFSTLVENAQKKQNKACIVFYCNGHTCKKSYKAAQKMSHSKLYNLVRSFDAGIFSWANKYNNQTILLGKVLTDKSKLINKQEYEQYSITKAEINDKFNTIDIRDHFQRKEEKIHLKAVKRIPLTRIRPLLKRHLIKDENLLFIDKVGKQNRWLHYYLKEYGYKNYVFLKGGSTTFNKNE
ncbi:rhodanese-like domain-containing protein [Endozoicomonas sp. SM1973]|uniref:Rhodanese-like domain-containing protein n=1 Tax=Spartinivicinus marinus TaxID=2994442 RepID=A0A853IA55_9GAMM|nr:rhodanese-like domain-containing protein [Spartinivicinus marinus]NYZ68672.1 rhodanese-like domain-containing protein [Spartinivicinus marinus]